MVKYLLLKHYRGAPASVNDVPMDQWTPEEPSAHVQYMHDFAARLEGTGEFVDSQALSPQGTFVRYDGEGLPPVTDGRSAETKDLIAGWIVIDVETYERALELAGGIRPGGHRDDLQPWVANPGGGFSAGRRSHARCAGTGCSRARRGRPSPVAASGSAGAGPRSRAAG